MAPPQEEVRRPQAQPQIPDKLGELVVGDDRPATVTVAMIDPANVFAMEDVNV
jgi:hypothetical protein